MMDDRLDAVRAMYGYESIPKEWRETLLKGEYIDELCKSFAEQAMKQ